MFLLSRLPDGTEKLLSCCSSPFSFIPVMPTVATSITKEKDVNLESQTRDRSHETRYTIHSQILTFLCRRLIYPEINSGKLVLPPWGFKLDFI